MRRLLTLLTLAATLLTSADRVAAQGVAPPEQPASGPGGGDYAFSDVAGKHHGEQPTGYWLFEPTGVAADAAPMPVVILLHGYGATDPSYLRDWIDHLVRHGRVVIFPDYQTDNPLRVPPLEYTGNMVDGVAAALGELRSGGHVGTTSAGLTVAGYSMGGVLALNYAALAESLDLPSPSAVMAVTPGGCVGCGGPGGSDAFGVPYRDLHQIEPDTKLLLVAGEDDDFVGTRPAEIAWEGTTQIPDENRDYLIARSDRHGEPALITDHTFPSNGDGAADVNALDWYGAFKWLDGLMACAADESTCEATMNGGAIELDMGAWSDGEPVNPPLLVENP